MHNKHKKQLRGRVKYEFGHGYEAHITPYHLLIPKSPHVTPKKYCLATAQTMSTITITAYFHYEKLVYKQIMIIHLYLEIIKVRDCSVPGSGRKHANKIIHITNFIHNICCFTEVGPQSI